MRRNRQARGNNESRRPGNASVASQLALDEAVARALQHYENKLAQASAVEETATEDGGGSSNPPNDSASSISTSNPAVQQDDIDPDNMSYEELQSVTEAVGSEAKGLSDEVIAFLPSSTYEKGYILRNEHKCTICLESYENKEQLITLPCKHYYHSQCITQWLKINKICPNCKEEVFG